MPCRTADAPGDLTLTTVRVVSFQKVCQVAGSTDFETGQATPDQAESRFGVLGTDLGFSFEHQGRVFFLFGDTGPRPGLARDNASDSIAVVAPNRPGTSLDAYDDLCQHMEFLRAPDGGYLEVRLDGATLGVEDVPLSGFSDGDSMYVFFLRHTVSGDLKSPFRAVVGVSHDQGWSFSTLLDGFPDFFQEVAPLVIDTSALPVPNLWYVGQPTVFLFAKSLSGLPYLALAPLRSFSQLSTWVYFGGFDAQQRPTWTPNSGEAVPVVCPGSAVAAGPAELSVQWEPHLRRYLMLAETVDPPGGIRLESAVTPWGPWTSSSQVVVDQDKARCHLTYGSESCNSAICPRLDETGTLNFLNHACGRLYGAYIIPGYDEWDEQSNTVWIYFTMSTFNPYTPLIMRAQLRTEQILPRPRRRQPGAP